MSPEPPSTSVYFIKLITYHVIFCILWLSLIFTCIYVNILSEYLVIRSCIASLFRHVNLILWKEKCILGRTGLFLGIWVETGLILRIYGAKEKYFQGAEEFWEISALFSGIKGA